MLPFSIDPVVEDVVERAELTLDYAHRFGREARAPICWRTQRRRLDAYLVDRAVEAGAEFRGGVRVHDRLPVDARIVIGADGANDASAQLLGLGGDIVHGVALEGNVRHGDVDRERYRATMVIELGVVPGGYGWVFPKADHVNVGVGGWLAEGPRLRAHLKRLCGELGHPGAARGAERAAVRLVYALARRAGDPGREFRPELA